MKNKNSSLGCVYNFIEVTQLAAYIKTLHESIKKYRQKIQNTANFERKILANWWACHHCAIER